MAVTPEDHSPRAGRAAIVGRPNAGKSTLLNTLLGQKLAIATPKPQTTRHHILGVYSTDDPPTQIAFVDTPGLHRPQNPLGRALIEEAQGALDGCDVIVWLIESPSDKTMARPSLSAADRDVRDLLGDRRGAKLVIALNKVDRLKDKSALFPWLAFYQEALSPEAIVPISGLRARGTKQLVGEIRKHLPEGLLYTDPDFVTDRPERFFVAELIREAVIRATHEEVPYAIAVVVEAFEETTALTRIEATIIVDKPNHKKIVVGAQGAMLKGIGTEARTAIEALLERKVFLGLFVKVVEGWTEDPNNVRKFAMEGRT
jgi:GTP-binding protein Era